jgi:3,4-dihydroxy 2-butanone 4-phosphate synthase/GTP cyclohydrolase II
MRAGGVLAEVVSDNGEMARFDELFAFARRFGMPIVTIRDLIAYCKREEDAVADTAAGLMRPDASIFAQAEAMGF